MAPLGFLGYLQINPPERSPRVKGTKILDTKWSAYFSWYEEAEKWLNNSSLPQTIEISTEKVFLTQ